MNMAQRATAWAGLFLGMSLSVSCSAAAVAERATPAAASAVTPISSEEVLRYLADEDRRGRGWGTPELEECAEWLQERLDGHGKVHRQVVRDEQGREGQNLWVLVAPASGSSSLEEWIVVGAHYDHLGVGGKDDPNPGAIYAGADDNASGVAVLLSALQRLRSDYPEPGRGILFVLFTGEESGLKGSRAFCAEPPVPLEQIRAMINLDTVGRFADGGLTLFGVESARSFEDILRGVDMAFGLEPKFVPRSSGASDDLPFAEAAIPTLHLFTGAHPEYHRPTDRLGVVDVDGLEQLSEFTAELVDYLAQSDTELDFVPAGAVAAVADPKRATEGRRRVSFGSIPDFQSSGGGVRITGVIPGSPAEKAGLQKDDVIVEFDGAPVDDLTDYSEAMKRYAPGDVVDVTFERGGDRTVVQVTLVERK